MKKLILLLLFFWIVDNSKAQHNLTLLGHLPYNVTTAGVWHYVDTVGNEYALVGASDRISIVDVTDPSQPTEVFTIPALQGEQSLWREIKTHGTFAYAVSEGGGGVIIIDLNDLPASINSKHWYGDGDILNQLNSAHTVAATDGYLYVFGSNIGVGGAIIADLADPWNPAYTGMYDLQYIHDGYIRNDTLWAGEIYEGQFSVIDVHDKSNPVLLANQPTPGLFCHNTWLSDDSQFLYTTDEVQFAPLGSYDITDLGNIEMVDVYWTDSMPTQEVHNVRVLNDYLINPSYGSQLTICDATRPDNIIEIANYTTGPYLCWDASPYLPSGNIIATDTQFGLYVFAPTYVRACYLEGIVTDSITGFPLFSTQVNIILANKSAFTDLTGNYKTGLITSGTYDIEFIKSGYESKIITGVSLTNGNLTNIDVQLKPFVLSGNVVSQNTGNAIPNVNISINTGAQQINAVSDVNGDFTFAPVPGGVYEVTAVSWGYITVCNNLMLSSTPLQIQMTEGYYDDFTTDLGWTVSGTAPVGQWERGEPVGTTQGLTQANPEVDVSGDCGTFAWVTGNGGGTFNDFDLDNGTTVLTSPVFNLSTYSDPYISFYKYLFIPAATGASLRDTLFIELTDGINTVIIDESTLGTMPMSSWNYGSIRVSNFITPSATMQLKVRIEDKTTSGNILEAGFDHFQVTEGPQSVSEINNHNSLQVYPNPFGNMFYVNTEKFVSGENQSLVLTDISGREINRTNVNSSITRIDTQDLRSGVYILRLEGNSIRSAPVKIIRQ